MVDNHAPSEPPPSNEPFGIPKPEIPPAGLASLLEAWQEFRTFQSGKAGRERLDWGLRYGLKILLFVFVLALNGWWDYSALQLLKRAGTAGSGVHLDDSVLITLISTSIANFLAL